MSRPFRRALAALTVLVFCSLPAAAGGDGKIWGRVVDGRGAPVVGPTIVLIDQEERVAPREALGDENGVFQFLGLAPGRYTLRAGRDRIGRDIRTDIAVGVSGDIYLELTLTAAALDAAASASQGFDASARG